VCINIHIYITTHIIIIRSIHRNANINRCINININRKYTKKK